MINIAHGANIDKSDNERREADFLIADYLLLHLIKHLIFFLYNIQHLSLTFYPDLSNSKKLVGSGWNYRLTTQRANLA